MSNLKTGGALLPLQIKLSREYEFEGEKVSVLDLTSLTDFTLEDYKEIKKMHNGINPASASLLDETDMGFLICAAQRASGLPMEFFDEKRLSIKDCLRIKNAVGVFLLG